MTDQFTEKTALEATIGDVLTNLPKKVEKPKVRVRPTVSLEEMIDRLRNRVERQLKSTLKELTEHSAERTTVIVGFLAILEMVKQGHVNAAQELHFEDIHVEKESTGTPRLLLAVHTGNIEKRLI